MDHAKAKTKQTKLESKAIRESGTYQGHGIGNLPDENLEGLSILLFKQLIGPILLRTLLSLAAIEARLLVHFEQLADLVGWQCVRRPRQRLVSLTGYVRLRVHLVF